MKQRERKTKGENPLPDIQVQVQESRTPIPGAPEEAINTNLDPTPENGGIKEVCLALDTGKALRKGQSQV